MIKKIIKILKNKKFYFILIVLLIFGYFGYSRFFKKEIERYILDTVKEGDLKVKVSGSGEIIPVDEIDIKSKVSGEIVFLNVKEGQNVKEGEILAKLDSEEVEKEIKDKEVLIKKLELDVESLRLKLKKTDFQYQNTLRGDDYKKFLNQGVLILNNFYNFYPKFIEDLDKIYFYKDFDSYSNNLEYYQSYNPSFKNKSQKLNLDYKNLKLKYSQLSESFKNILDGSDIKEKIIKDSYDLVVNSYNLVNEGKEIVRFLKEDLILKNSKHEKEDIIENHFQKLTDYLSELGVYKQNLFEVISKINSYKDIINNYEFDKNNLEISIKQKEIELEQAKSKIDDLKDTLNDYYIIAPIGGILSSFSIKRGDLVVSKQIIGKIITNQKVARISLNEVDVAQVKVGKEAILTFDAFPDLEIKGKIIEISTVGNEEQGVVSYDVKISLGNLKKEIKPGMSANAEIIINNKQNVLLVPNSAIKTDEKGQYVEIVKNYNLGEKENLTSSLEIPKEFIERKYIKVGISNEDFTEVLDGLKRGDVFISKVSRKKTSQNRQRTNPFLPRSPFGQQRR